MRKLIQKAKELTELIAQLNKLGIELTELVQQLSKLMIEIISLVGWILILIKLFA